MDAAMEDISKPRKRRTLASIRQEYEDEQKKRNLEMANFDEEGVVDNSPRSPPVHKEPLREIESFDTLKEYMDYLEMLDEESDRGRKDVPDHPTIFFTPPTRFNTPQHLPLREPGTKAVRSASKFVVGLSSSLDGKPLKRCSGFWIDYDEEKGIGTLLTTAHLIRTKEPERADSVWLGGREYVLMLMSLFTCWTARLQRASCSTTSPIMILPSSGLHWINLFHYRVSTKKWSLLKMSFTSEETNHWV